MAANPPPPRAAKPVAGSWTAMARIAAPSPTSAGPVTIRRRPFSSRSPTASVPIDQPSAVRWTRPELVSEAPPVATASSEGRPRARRTDGGTRRRPTAFPRPRRSGTTRIAATPPPIATAASSNNVMTRRSQRLVRRVDERVAGVPGPAAARRLRRRCPSEGDPADRAPDEERRDRDLLELVRRTGESDPQQDHRDGHEDDADGSPDSPAPDGRGRGPDGEDRRRGASDEDRRRGRGRRHRVAAAARATQPGRDRER